MPIPILLFAALPQLPLAFPPTAGDDPDGNPVLWTAELSPLDVAALAAGAPTTSGFGGTTSALGGACSGIAQDLVLNADLVEGDAPTAIAWRADGSTYLIAHRDSRNVVEFDGATDAFVRAIDVSGSPQDVAVAPDGSFAVTANVFEGTASFVDLATGVEVAVVGGLNLPVVARITDDSSLAVIGTLGDQDLVVFDLATATELRRVSGMGFSATLSAAPENGSIALGVDQLRVTGTTAVHTDRFADEIELIDLTTGIATVLPSLDAPRPLAVTPDGSLAVVGHTGTDQRISVVDIPGATIVKTIDVGQAVRDAVAVDAAGSKAAVSILNAVVVVDLATGAVGFPLNTATVYGLLPTADGQHVLGVGFRGPLIEWSSGQVVAELNNFVSTSLGAVSPTQNRGVLAATTFGEDRLVVDTSGAGGALLLTDVTGEGLEADSTRRVAVSLDGQRAVTTNILMDTATVWDVPNRSILGVVSVGDRPSDVAITPDGSTAVVANLDSDFASVIDLATLAVSNVAISTRGSEVEVSPDGQYAYVAVVSGGDGVWRIDLGTLATAGGKLATGNMGTVGFSYFQTSGMTLSPDGTTLAVCGSFDDQLTLIDATTWTVLGTAATGSFPVRASWAPTGGFVFVACRDSNELTRVRVVGGQISVVATIPTGQWPYELRLTQDGKTLYVLEYLDETVGVVDVVAGARIGGVILPDNPAGLVLDPAETHLYAVTGGWSATIGGSVFSIDETGDLVVIDTQTLAVQHVLDNGWAPAGLVATPSADVLLVPAPRGDGLGFARLDRALVASVDSVSLSAGGSQDLCLDAGVGQAGQLYVVLGSASGTAPGITLDGVNLPLNVDAYTLYTLDQAGTPPFVGTIGLLDGLGEAAAQIALPPASDPGLAGVEVVHAFVAIDPVFGVVGFASEPVGLTLLP